MERLETADNLFLKALRQHNIDIPREEIREATMEILKTGFFMGMLAYQEYTEELAQLPIMESLQELQATIEDIKAYFDEDKKREGL